MWIVATFQCKVHECYSITCNQTLILDQCVVCIWGPNNKHHKDTCLKEIGLPSPNCINYSTLNNEPNQEDRWIPSRNQQTCPFDNHNYIKGGVNFSSKFCLCFIIDPFVQHKFSLCKSNRHKLENMLYEPNNTHTPSSIMGSKARAFSTFPKPLPRELL